MIAEHRDARMLTLLEIIKKTTEFFAGKGIENPRLNAELLVGHALGLKRMQLYLQFERPLADPELDKIRPLVRRRGAHEPVQYIVGETEWGGMLLKTDRRALIPRPETELLLEIVTKAVPKPPARVLDLGTGSGALALGLAKVWADTKVDAVDKSDEALALARENAERVGVLDRVSFFRSDWFSELSADSRYELIVANPPYLSASETAATAVEVHAYEPHTALTAEDNGLADLRSIIRGAPAYLAPEGLLGLETGIEQHTELLSLCAEAGFPQVTSHRDLTGRDRFILARP